MIPLLELAKDGIAELIGMQRTALEKDYFCIDRPE